MGRSTLGLRSLLLKTIIFQSELRNPRKPKISINKMEVGQENPEEYFGKISANFDPRDQATGSLFKTVLFYCVLVIGGPLVGFFTTNTLILGAILHWDQSEIRTDVVSAIVAVVVLHIALGLFIMKAYFSTEDKKEKIGKRD